MYDAAMRVSIGLAVLVVGAILVYAFGCAPGDQRADWVMVALTGALIYVGGTQAYIYWKQAELMRHTLDATQKSAEAASVGAEATKKSVEAELARQRPRLLGELRYEFTFAVRGTEQTGGKRSDFICRVMYRNWGGSTAWVDGRAVAVVVVSLLPGGNPMPHVAREGNIAACAMRAVDPGQQDHGEPVEKSFSVDDWNAVQRRTAELVVSGAIAYQDPLGTRYLSGFCWILTSTGVNQSNHSQTFETRRGPKEYFFDVVIDS